jgi:transcriptional regulator with XRE-family HTH domain
MTQHQVADRAGVSPETVRSYEGGRKHPTREHLSAILDALYVPRDARNAVLICAGFAPDGHALTYDYPRGMFLPHEAVAHVASMPWPAFVLDEYMKVLGANSVAQRLWGVNLDHEYTDDVDRNLLSVASDPRFADRCMNWDEAVRDLLAVFKGKDRGPDDLENPSPYFSAVLEKFLAGDPRYVSKLLDLWRQAEPKWDRKMRWTYRIQWREPTVLSPLNFVCLATPAHHGDATAFNDWIPTDASTWTALRELSPSVAGNAPP